VTSQEGSVGAAEGRESRARCASETSLAGGGCRICSAGAPRTGAAEEEQQDAAAMPCNRSSTNDAL